MCSPPQNQLPTKIPNTIPNLLLSLNDQRSSAEFVYNHRKLLTRDNSYLWPRLTLQAQSNLKSLLLSSVHCEESKSISKKLCDTISELASNLLPDNTWPELLPFMIQSVTSDSVRLQESALLIFAKLSQFTAETLIPHLGTLHSVFLQCLPTSSSADVRIAALDLAAPEWQKHHAALITLAQIAEGCAKVMLKNLGSRYSSTQQEEIKRRQPKQAME